MSRKLSLKTLQKNNWNLCRQIVKLLAKDRCEICGGFYMLQVDHCFSRNNKELFYEISNLTLLCAFCHNAKTNRLNDMDLCVYEHVERREGLDKFNNLRLIAGKKGGFPDWSKKWYQEEMNLKLRDKLQQQKGD